MPRVTLTISSSGRRTTSSFCGSSGTTAFTAHIERCRTLKPSRKPGAKVWKRQFARDGFCSQGPWPDRMTSDSRSGCCSPRDSRGGEDPGPGQPAQHWQKSLRDDFKAFGALHGSTPTDRRTFGVDRLVWTEAACKREGVPWYTGVLLGAEIFMVSWHKSEEEASKLREVNRAA